MCDMFDKSDAPPLHREASMGDEEMPGRPRASGRPDPGVTDPGTGSPSRPLRPAGEPGPPQRVTGISAPVGELKQNIEQVFVNVTRDKLKGHIESFARGHLRKFQIGQLLVEAASSLAIALALGVPLFTATFQKFGSFSASTWKAICVVGAAFALAVAIIQFIRGIARAVRRTEDHKEVAEVVKAIEEDRDFPTST